jgi:hypothetical protein
MHGGRSGTRDLALRHGAGVLEPLRWVACLLIPFAAACSSASETAGPSPLKCQLTASSPTSSVPAGGASGTVTVSTTPDCSWTASSGASWIAITSSSSGQGNGSV